MRITERDEREEGYLLKLSGMQAKFERVDVGHGDEVPPALESSTAVKLLLSCVCNDSVR